MKRTLFIFASLAILLTPAITHAAWCTQVEGATQPVCEFLNQASCNQYCAANPPRPCVANGPVNPELGTCFERNTGAPALPQPNTPTTPATTPPETQAACRQCSRCGSGAFGIDRCERSECTALGPCSFNDGQCVPKLEVCGFVGGTDPQNSPSTYEFSPLQPITLPGGEELYNESSSLGETLNRIVRVLIGVAGILAVAMFVYGAFRYATTDAVSGKEEGKGIIKQALLGLLLALTSVVILNTINPDILDLNVLKPIVIPTGTAGEWEAGEVVHLPGGVRVGSGGTITGGNCRPEAGSACSPERLQSTCMAEHLPMASQICQMESNANPSAPSGTDKCSDGSSWSIGLYQINMFVHHEALGCQAPSQMFDYTRGDDGLPACEAGQWVQTAHGKYCKKRICSVPPTKRAAYQACVQRASNPTINTSVACRLIEGRIERNQNPWGDWIYSFNRCS